MTIPPKPIKFQFEPSWECIEQFLRIYADLNAMKSRRTIDVWVGEDFYSTLPGYPNRTRNAFLTLEFAIQQMNRAFHCGNSLVNCVIKPTGTSNE